MSRSLGALLCALCACTPTYVQFRNATPGATLENLRWTPTDHPECALQQGRLLPGETSYSHRVMEPYCVDFEEGKLTFDLVVEGSRLSLRARDPVGFTPEQTSVLSVGPDTRTVNDLLQRDGGDGS